MDQMMSFGAPQGAPMLSAHDPSMKAFDPFAQNEDVEMEV